MKKMWKWIKKNWKIVIKVIIFLITAVLSIFITLKVRKAILGKVTQPITFIPDGKDDNIIHVYDGKKFIPVKLPLNKEGKQMKAKDVTGAGFSRDKFITVEGKHKKVDRRNVKEIKNNALDEFKDRRIK